MGTRLLQRQMHVVAKTSPVGALSQRNDAQETQFDPDPSLVRFRAVV